MHAPVDPAELVQRAHHPQRHASGARGERIEKANFHIGLRPQVEQHGVGFIGMKIVQEQPDTDATRRRRAQRRQKVSPGCVGRDDVVLDIQ